MDEDPQKRQMEEELVFGRGTTYSYTNSNIRYMSSPFARACVITESSGAASWRSLLEYIGLFCLSINTRSIEETAIESAVTKQASCCSLWRESCTEDDCVLILCTVCGKPKGTRRFPTKLSISLRGC